jgi:hypothetical protein
MVLAKRLFKEEMKLLEATKRNVIESLRSARGDVRVRVDDLVRRHLSSETLPVNSDEVGGVQAK